MTYNISLISSLFRNIDPLYHLIMFYDIQLIIIIFIIHDVI